MLLKPAEEFLLFLTGPLPLVRLLQYQPHAWQDNISGFILKNGTNVTGPILNMQILLLIYW